MWTVQNRRSTGFVLHEAPFQTPLMQGLNNLVSIGPT